VEAARLRDADGRPDAERRDLLADLASRLDALLRGTTHPAYEPLRLLVAELRSGGDLDAGWAEARRVLDGFDENGRGTAAGPGAATDSGTGPGARPSRAGFWKR